MIPSPEFWGVSQVGWQAISALMTIVAFLVALGAARVAWTQLKLNREIRADQTRPYVVVDFESSPASINLTDLVARNIGTTPAFEVRIRLSPTPSRARETARYELAKARLLDGVIPMFAPGRELRMFFDSMPDRYEHDMTMSFECSVSYRGGRKNWYKEVATVDMDVGRGMLQTDVLGMHHLAKAARELQKDFHKSPLRKGPIPVMTEDRGEYRDRRRAEAEEAQRGYDELMSQIDYVSDDGSSANERTDEAEPQE